MKHIAIIYDKYAYPIADDLTMEYIDSYIEKAQENEITYLHLSNHLAIEYLRLLHVRKQINIIYTYMYQTNNVVYLDENAASENYPEELGKAAYEIESALIDEITK